MRQRANFLGCDLARPHLVALIEISQVKGQRNDKDVHPASAPLLQTEDERLAAHKHISIIIRRRIQEAYPVSVVYEHENLLTCILCLSKDPNTARLKTWLRDLSRQMRSEQDVRLSIGVGNTRQSIGDYRRGFAEASEALQKSEEDQASNEATWSSSFFQSFL